MSETVGAQDLRRELMERLRNPEIRERIADALITEAEGGPPDPKTGVPKGGATVIRAFELIREIALEKSPEPSAVDWDLSRYADDELRAMLTRLDSSWETDWTGGVPTNDGAQYGRVPPNDSG